MIMKSNNYKIFSKSTFIILITVFWILLGALFSVLGYRAGLIGTIICVGMYFFLDDEQKYLIILSALPFAAIFKVSAGLPSSIFLLYILFVLNYILKKRRFSIEDLLYLIIFIILQVITVIIYKASLVNICSFFLNIVFVKICALNFSSIKIKICF